jgi:hypothetical protein
MKHLFYCLLLLFVILSPIKATFIPLTVQELDGSPSVSKVKNIIFNGSNLTAMNNGTVLVSSFGSSQFQRSFSSTVLAGQIQPIARIYDTEGTIAQIIQVQSATAGHSGTQNYLFQGGFTQLSTSWSRMVPYDIGRGHGNSYAGFDLYVRQYGPFEYMFGVAANTNTKNLITTFTNLGRSSSPYIFTDVSSNGTVAVSSVANVYSHRNFYVESNVGIGVANSNVSLKVGNGTANFIDGLNDILVSGDVEVDGNIYASNFSGTARSFYSTVLAGQIQPIARIYDNEGSISQLIQVQSITSENSGTKNYLFQGGYNQLSTSWSKMVPSDVGRGHGESYLGFDLYVRQIGGYEYMFGVAANTSTKALLTTFTNLGRSNSSYALTDVSTNGTVAVSSAANIYSHRNFYVESNVGIGTDSPQRALQVNDVMRLTPRSSAPGSPASGDIYIDSDGSQAVCVYLNGAWVVMAGTGSCI